MTPNWRYIQAHYDWLGHMAEGLVMAGLVMLLSLSFCRRRDAALIGLAFAIGHFHGREKRDYEISVHMPPPHLDGYRLWDWNWDQATDFWPTALLLAALLYLVVRRKA